MTQYNWSELPVVLSVRQTAEILGVSQVIVYNMLKADALPKVRIGKNFKIGRDALRRWIENASA